MYNKIKILKQIRQLLTNGHGVYTACKIAGISYVTLYSWKNRWPRIERYIDTILVRRTQLVEDALYKSALKGSNYAQTFWLKNRGTNWKDTALIDQSQHIHLTSIKGAIESANRNAGKNRIPESTERARVLETKSD